VAVDRWLGQRDALVTDLDVLANRSELAGAILLEDGRVALVLQPAELMDRAASGNRVARTSTTTESDAASHSPAETEAQASRVLIVDDSFTTRTLEKNILEAHGYEVSVAVDGSEALALLRREPFALVISDIQMPTVSGYDLLKEMKADPRLGRIPVILVTSRDKPEDRQLGLQLGADAYIIKRKFDHQDLLSTIKQLL
jgi:two-component system chemotaxis sensor kinase CheA